MPDYISILKPDFFSVENVREFLKWGPLDAHNMPIKALEGTIFNAWVDEIKSLNSTYEMEYKILNAADYGAYTTRKRLFILFSEKAAHITWPVVTHFKGSNYKPVKEVLNFQNIGNCVLTRKKALSEATLERIYNGLRVYKKQYTITYYSTGKNHQSIEEPSPTLTTKDRVSIIMPFMLRDFTKGYLASVEDPSGTLLTIPKSNIVTAHLLNPQWGNSSGKSIEEPSFTLIARMDKAPPYLVVSTAGTFSIAIDPSDSYYTKKIKQYMIDNQIAQLTIRPLEIPEMLQIQGFPKNYQLVGSLTEQKKYIGNSVETTVMHKWIESVINTF